MKQTEENSISITCSISNFCNSKKMGSKVWTL